MSGHHPFDALEGHRYVALTTYRKNGEGISTPVWIARVGDALYVFTDIESGKVKRIRNDPRVTLAPSDIRGNARGRSVEAVARIMNEREFDGADRALRGKYGWQYRAFRVVLRLQGKNLRSVFLELRPLNAG